MNRQDANRIIRAAAYRREHPHGIWKTLKEREHKPAHENSFLHNLKMKIIEYGMNHG